MSTVGAGKVTERKSYSSSSPWEPVIGYARALRVGSQVLVSGTTATDTQGEIVGIGDPYAQARQALRNIVQALAALGASPADVVRTRMFVTDISRWQDYGRAHAEVFGAVRPCTSMVEVSRLIDARMLVEIEADAIIAA